MQHEDYYSKHGTTLWDDLGRLEHFLERHFISIRGEDFYCTLRDSKDGTTKILAIRKAMIDDSISLEEPIAKRKPSGGGPVRAR